MPGLLGYFYPPLFSDQIWVKRFSVQLYLSNIRFRSDKSAKKAVLPIYI